MQVDKGESERRSRPNGITGMGVGRHPFLLGKPINRGVLDGFCEGNEVVVICRCLPLIGRFVLPLFYLCVLPN